MIAQIQNVILYIKLFQSKVWYLTALALIVSLVMINNIALAYETGAEFAFLQDYTTGTVLYEKHSDDRLVPSSMTKLMTLYIVYKQLHEKTIKLEDVINISENAWRTGGSKMFVSIGTQVSIEDLINGIAVQSGNDACVAIAEGLGGNEAAFAEQMNRVAQQIGMTNSHFTNASGLPDEQHYSTARDLALLAYRIIHDFPEYYHYLAKREYTYNGITQPNRNLLLGIGGVDGLKTGHTDAGGYGIVISAERNGQRLIGVVNGLATEAIRKKEAENLLNYGFGNFSYKMMYKAEEKIVEVPVLYGKTRAQLVAMQDVAVLTPKMQGEVSAKVRYNSPLIAPIVKGSKVAEVVMTHGGQETTVPLTVSEDVPEVSIFCRMWHNMKYYAFGQ